MPAHKVPLTLAPPWLDTNLYTGEIQQSELPSACDLQDSAPLDQAHRREMLSRMWHVALFLAAVAAAPAPDPAQIVRLIYNDHQPWARKSIRLDDPKVTSRYFDASLVDLLRRDAEESARAGDVGCLDWDPFLQAQDYDEAGITEPRIRDLNRQGETALEVTFTGKSPAWKNWNVRAVYVVVKTPAGWRVHDIEMGKSGSLRKVLACAESAAASPCNAAAAKAEKESAMFSPPGAYRVTGKGRLAFHTAPAKGCEMKGVFVIPGDELIAYREYQGWYDVMYMNQKTGADAQGWVRSERLTFKGKVGPTN